MKQFILFLFLLLPFCVNSQVNETFDGPEIGSANPWRVDSAGFFVKDGRLQFDASRRAKGIHTIKLDIPYHVDGMEWMFDVSFSYKPTNNNHVRAFVYATGEPTDVAYFIQVGHNEGNVSLYSWPPSSEPQRVIKGRGGILAKGSNSVRVKLTLENNSKLVLYTRLNTESYFHKEGECKVVSSGVRKGGVLNLQCRYQAASMDNMITSFDNIIVSDHITPTPLEPDEPDVPDDPAPSPEDPPSLLDIEPMTLSSLQFTFDKPVDIKDAVFSISSIGDAYRQGYADEETMTRVNTLFSKEMKVGTNYTISYKGLTDLSGNRLPTYSEDLKLSADGEEEPGAIPAGSVLINEVMADPKGLKELSETEYVELHNTTGNALSLAGWRFVYGGSAKKIGNIRLPAKGYAVLYRSGREIKVDAGGLAVPMDDFPAALANAGKELQLRDASDEVIDKVSYAKATPAKSWERTSSGWYLSTDPRGGTPGSANSSSSGEEEEPPVDPDDPDDPDDPEEPDTPVITDPIQPGDIVFNELLPDPYAGGSEYIELYNRSDQPLSLSALSIATRKSDGTLSTRYPLQPVGKRLEAGGYVLLTKEVEKVTSFYDIADPSALHQLKLPVLANTSSTLVLFRTADETVVIDEVSYSSKWHAPSVKNRKGVALERIDPEAATQLPANWTSASATAGYGTPGYRNSQDKEASSGSSTGIEPPVWIEETGSYSISYLLDRPGYSCRAYVFNTSGQRVAEISNHQLLGTSGELIWSGIAGNGSPLHAGLYIFYAEIYHPEGAVKRFKKAFLVR